MSERLLTSHEVAELLQVSPSTVLAWVKQGILPAFRTPGGHRRIRASELVSFLRSHDMPVPDGFRTGQRLLVIDDDPALLRSLRRQLARSVPDLEVEIAEGPIDGLLKVGTFHPDAVILDGYMPGMDGVEVCQRLKADPATQPIDVIALTGRPSPELEQRFRQAGAVAFLAKPLEIEKLLEVLSSRGLAPAAKQESAR